MPTYKTKKGTIKSKPISKPAQKLLGMKPVRKKAGGGKVPTPKTKTQAFADYKKKHGYHHKADPRHPMNSERTGAPKKMARGGATKKKSVPAPKSLSKAMREKYEKNLSYENMVAPEKGSSANPAKNSRVLQKKAFNKTLKDNPQAVKRLNEMKKKANAMKSGGKLKMVEKGGKKVPFYAADGVGKMKRGGTVKVGEKGTAKTLSQIAKQNGVTLKSLLAANPSIKNANKIRLGQSIKVPGAEAGKAATSSNPYKGIKKAQMADMDVKNKSEKRQRRATRSMQTQAKMGTGMSPTPSKAKAAKDSRSAIPEAKKKKLIAEGKKSGKKSFFSSLFGKKSGGAMKKAKGYKSGGTVRGAGAATKGKRFGRCG